MHPQVFLNLFTFALVTRLAVHPITIALNLAPLMTHASSTRIPIGSIFDINSTIQYSAFKRGIESHNKEPTSLFLLDRYESKIFKQDVYHFFRAMCSTTLRGVFLFVGTANYQSIRSIESFSRKYEMPYITTLAPPSRAWNHNQSFTLFLRPSYLNVLHDVIVTFKWSKVYYLYTDDDGLARVEYLNSVFNKDETVIEFIATRLRNLERCHSTLRQMDSLEHPNADKFIILDVSDNDALQFLLRQVQTVGMNRANYHYLLCTLAMDELYLSEFRLGGANVTGFRLVNTKGSHRGWMRVDPKFLRKTSTSTLESSLMNDAVALARNGLSELMRRHGEMLKGTMRRGQLYNNNTKGIPCRLTEKPNVWVHGRLITDVMKSVKFEGTSGRVSFNDLGQRVNYSLQVVSHLAEDTYVKIGHWHSMSGLKFPTSDKDGSELSLSKFNRTRKVVSIMSHPYMMERKLKQQEIEAGMVLEGNDLYEGYCSDLARMIADAIGFDYVIEIVKDGKYGEKMQDGNWNGMVGVLSRREADIAIAPMTISSMRERVIDFSKPFMNLGISIMIKKPEKQKPGVFSFMDPLSYNIWMCIIFSYLAVSSVLFLVSRFSPNEWQIEDSEHGPAFVNDLTLLNSMWFSLGAFMRRGCEVCPRSLAGRVVGSAWWFFTLIIISSYTANLAAFLTIERMLTPIKNADDLAKQSEIAYGTLDAGSTKDFFKTSKIPTYEKMWNFMSNEPGVFVRTTEEGISKVRNSKGKYAFLLESSMNDYYNQRKPCDTMKVGDNLDSKGYGVATYIGSDLREKINVIVLQLLEKEHLQKLHKKWWYDKGECIVESENKGSGSSQSLSLSNVAGIFYILISGLGLSMLAASVEFIFKSKMEVKRKKRRYLDKMRSNESHIYETTPEKENGGYVYTTPCAMTTVVSTDSSEQFNEAAINTNTQV